MTTVNADLRAIPDFDAKVKEAKQTADGLRGTSHFYRKVLGVNASPVETDKYREVGERHYAVDALEVLSVKSLAKLTRDASVEKPVVIDGVPVELVARVGKGDGVRRLVNLDRVDVSYPYGYGRFVYTEPVRDVTYVSLPRLVALHPDVFLSAHKGYAVLAKWREEHPGYGAYVAEDEVEALCEFATEYLATTEYVAPKSFNQNLSMIPTVDSLKGCVADKGVILYGSEVVAYGLYLSAEAWKARGGKGARQPIHCGTSMKQAAQLLEIINREPKYRMVWCNSKEKTYLYTHEEREFLRDWLQEEAGLGAPSEVWVKRAKEKFTNTESEVLYAISHPVITIAKQKGEDAVLNVLRKHKATGVRVKRMTKTQGIAPARMSDLLYTADVAEKILTETTGLTLAESID
jgi:hypothetical protein